MILVSGLVVAALLPAGRILTGLLTDKSAEADLYRGLWTTFFADLRSWGLFLGGLGLLLAAGSTSLLESFHPWELLRGWTASLRALPKTRSARLLMGVLLLTLGVLAIVFPAELLSGVVVLLGALIAYEGARGLFRLVAESVEAAPAPGKLARESRVAFRSIFVIGAMAVLAFAWIMWRRPGITPVPALATQACNGVPELCARRLDQVVFPGAHNAMSNQDIPDWMFPHYQADIPTQLRAGIRALLFDVHRLVGVEEGRHNLYLCHGFCELGAYLLVPTLEKVRDFLIENPDEVLVMIVEDYVTPEDLAKAFRDSRLADFVFRFATTPEWPTLGALIASGQRVIVFIESGRPGVPWLLPAFHFIQETPYTFHSPQEFSCRPNRGGTSGSLFLLNHWIETTPAPRPSNAAVVNAHDFLLKRALQCAADRQHVPNIIAVDFYATGDVAGVARELNQRNLGPSLQPPSSGDPGG